MEKIGLQLMACLRAYRFNQPAEITETFQPEDWQRLYQFGGEHKLIPVVYETLRIHPEFCEGDPALKARWKQSTLLQAAGQASRTQQLIAVTKALTEAGVRYALVKGALCRQLYPQPDLRVSGDEDLFIPSAHRQIAGNVLTTLGFVPINPKETSFVDHWIDKSSGLHLELHTALFDSGWSGEEALNPWLNQALETPVTASVEGVSIATLHPTAHFVFLLAHALKHFIAGGFGARTLCDILSFAQVYHDQIDQATVYDLLEQIHGRIFFDQILAIGKDYLAFDYTSLNWDLSEPADYAPLLDDMLDAGIYGQTTMDRRHSGALVLDTVRNNRSKNSFLSAVFPPASQLSGRYPALKKFPILLPACWVHRAGAYGLELLRNNSKGNSPIKTVSLGKQRTEMMIKYGIIPQTKTKN